MPIPTTTEPPLELLPTGADSFTGRAAQRATGDRVRELDHRCADSIDVRLLWTHPEERVLLVVCDGKTGDAFSLEVESGDALEAFHHPYAYAAFRRAA